MKKEIYLIRHGETENNRLKIWSGCTDECNIGLNNTGRAQALSVANSLSDVGLEAVFCSPLIRAAELGQVLSRRLNIPAFTQFGLQECDYGAADGMPISKVFEEMPDIAEKFIEMRKDYFPLSFPNGEILQDVYERMIEALDNIVRMPYQKVAATSHAGAICVLLCSLGVDYPKVPNCGYAKIVYDGKYHFDGKIIAPKL